MVGVVRLVRAAPSRPWFSRRRGAGPVRIEVLGCTWALATIYYFLMVPDRAFDGSRLEPVISHRATAISRVTFLTLLYGTLTLIDLRPGGAVRAWRVFESIG